MIRRALDFRYQFKDGARRWQKPITIYTEQQSRSVVTLQEPF